MARTIEKAMEEKYGVDYRKEYLDGRMSHEEYYDKVIEFLGGLDVVAKYVPFDIETLKRSYNNDNYFNSPRITPLRTWDFGAAIIKNLYSRFGINCASVSDGVCILKQAAMRMIERELEETVEREENEE